MYELGVKSGATVLPEKLIRKSRASGSVSQAMSAPKANSAMDEATNGMA